MSRQGAVNRAAEYFDSGSFIEDLSQLVAWRTESQNPAQAGVLRDFLVREMTPRLEAMGFDCRVLDNPVPGGGPFLIGRLIEDPALPTVLTYGHGDVVMGMEDRWQDEIDPWKVTPKGDRYYGRGAADNKGQYLTNLGGLAAVKAERGSLGFNVTMLMEMGEEAGSRGLAEICEQNKDLLKADVLIASDGPRLDPDRATIFLGSRGAVNFEMICDLRDGAHHSGNWGGLLINPGIVLANAIASIIDKDGVIQVPALKPESIPESVKKVLAKIEVTGKGGPEINPGWGEPGLSLAEKVYAWNTFEVLAYETGNPAHPANAIPASAKATCHIRYVVGSEPDQLIQAVRDHLKAKGFDSIRIPPSSKQAWRATRLDPEDPWVKWAVKSFTETAGYEPALLPNLGGSLPNDAFAETLGLPTIWAPHSYGGCSQHAPNEHILAAVSREGLQLMAGLFYDLAEGGIPKG